MKQEFSTVCSFRNVFTGLCDNPESAFYSDETINSNVNSQNNRLISTENLHDVPSHDVEVGEWCAVSALE